MAGVVFNALAVPNLTEHFQIKTGALLNALGLYQLALLDEVIDPLSQLKLDGFNRRHDLVTRGHVMAFRVDHKARHFLPDAACERVKQLQRLNLVVKQLDAQGKL